MEKIEISVTSLQSALDCPLCFWISEKIGPHPSIFPGIPSQIDSVIKGYMKQFIGTSDLPPWFPIRGELIDMPRILKAEDDSTGVVLKGLLDALVKDPTDMYYVIDYKTGRPQENVPDYYQTQLDGYAYLLEQNGFKPVAGGVLLYFTPNPGEISDKFFPFKITPVRARVNPDRIPKVLEHVKKILELENPPPRNESCETCMWLEQVGRRLFG
ncbi:MAG: hypothetical protein DRN83_01680 [Hadesarchaea archaeon]|nr:MAG: hypothetical protein DRN83_01680 [Hadesarchaea archaeon]HDI12610.1 hypothetical protein [Hadesarchaea archaeon]